MSEGESAAARQPGELEEIRSLFAALIEELDRSLDNSHAAALHDDDLQRVHRAKESASKALSLIENLRRSK